VTSFLGTSWGRFSAEPGNLLSLHSLQFSGLANNEVHGKDGNDGRMKGWRSPCFVFLGNKKCLEKILDSLILLILIGCRGRRLIWRISWPILGRITEDRFTAHFEFKNAKTKTWQEVHLKGCNKF